MSLSNLIGLGIIFLVINTVFTGYDWVTVDFGWPRPDDFNEPFCPNDTAKCTKWCKVLYERTYGNETDHHKNAQGDCHKCEWSWEKEDRGWYCGCSTHVDKPYSSNFRGLVSWCKKRSRN